MRTSKSANERHPWHFRLLTAEGNTRLALSAHGFPTGAIFHHTAFYWAGTLHVLKAHAERLGRE